MSMKGSRTVNDLGALNVHPPAEFALSQGLGGETVAILASSSSYPLSLPPTSNKQTVYGLPQLLVGNMDRMESEVA